MTGEASGKLLLFGEHAAVYGHPAVGVSLPQSTTVRFEGPLAGSWRLDEVPEEDRVAVGRVLAQIEAGLPGLAAARGYAVRITSGVPRNSGFGSSAALCGALARAALRVVDGEPAAADTERAWRLAHEAERLFHGTPSGVDTGLALLGGTCVFWPQPPGIPRHELLRQRGVTLVAAAVPRDEACARLVAGLATRLKAGDLAVRAAIDELGRVAAEAARALRSERGGTELWLGDLAEEAMRVLESLGLSTPQLELMGKAARAAGALGAKLSGAGGGGAWYAVARDRESAQRIVSGVRAAASRAGVTLRSPPQVVVA